MLNLKNAFIASTLLAAGLPAAAQMPKVGGLVQVWYSQMMDSNLRNYDTQTINYHKSFFNAAPAFKENGLAIKRIDVRISGSFTDNLEYWVMFDPTITTAGRSANPNINTSGSDANIVLQDVYIKYKMPYNLELQVGQYKPLQTLDGLIPPSDSLFVENTMMGLLFGGRDRGASLSVGFGDKERLSGRFHAGVFNASGKASADSNSQKDLVARLEMNYGKHHAFGAYTLQGIGAAGGSIKARSFEGINVPSEAEIIDNNDKTTNMGAFYSFQSDKIYASAEFIAGLWGRRFPSLASNAELSAAREHLEQSFLGYAGVFAYKINKQHFFLARYDTMNFNSGDKWYTPANPYLNKGYSNPRYTEITLGYTYVMFPESYRTANIKVNYIKRDKGFLMPMLGQTGEQGGDTFVIALQVGF
ncbi:MAG: OprO/OprP family phosphate-selective porin [Holophagales bacterium]|jgi:hypothetical protein|nr:OprO/OprP family phosphate-selective porin [Holophagales bacterium]